MLWLMLARLVVATLLLGATVLSGAESKGGYGGFTPGLLLSLIAGTYGVTIAFALWLPRADGPVGIGAAQLAWDLILVTGLVYVSGGVVSVFSFLYGVVVLMASLIVGPNATRLTTAAALVLYTTGGVALANGWIPPPPDQLPSRYHLETDQFGLPLVSNVVGLVLVALLADNLATRLRRTGGELQRATENVASLERLNEDIVRSIPSGLLTADLDGRVHTVNPAACAMFHADAELLRGQALQHLLPVDPDQPSEDARRDGTATRPDGSTFPVGFTATSLVDADGTAQGTLVTFQDLTEIAQLRAAAERAERLAALGRLAAGLAHEIRNPLSSISGSVELVREGDGLDEEDRRLLGIVLRETSRLNDLVTTMLQVGRPKSPHRSVQDLRPIASDVVDVARSGEGGGVGVRIELGTPNGPVEAAIDPDQVRQVLWNLLKNALQASPPGGTVTVTVRRREGNAQVEVTDQGPGISEKDEAKLFDTFYSGRPHGVGLGLALVKQIVDAHGARVEVESTPGEGARFSVRFPPP